MRYTPTSRCSVTGLKGFSYLLGNHSHAGIELAQCLHNLAQYLYQSLVYADPLKNLSNLSSTIDRYSIRRRIAKRRHFRGDRFLSNLSKTDHLPVKYER